MKDFLKPRGSSLVILLLASVALILGGCATADPDNASARPWNSPKTWESGLPSNVYEGR